MRTVVSALLLIFLTACAVTPVETPSQIALLAPFEGRYRDIGYNALYAAQLAITEHGSQFELLPIDDGGTVQTATERAHALSLDERVLAVIVMGYAATETTALEALDDLPVLVAGYWGTSAELSNIFTMHHPDVPAYITTPARVEITRFRVGDVALTGGLLFSSAQFAELYANPQGFTVVSSFELPNDDFIERYLGASPFAPQPGLIASATFVTTRHLLDHVDPSMSREQLLDALRGASAPDLDLHFYAYSSEGVLVPVDRIVEEG